MCAEEPERRVLSAVARPGVEVHRSGVGADAAAALMERLGVQPMRAMIAASLCGAIDPTLPVGAVVVAERVVHENSGEVFLADDLMLAATTDRRGTLVSSPNVDSPADRAALTGLVVDSTTATLARAARAAEVPFIAIGAVRDRFQDRVPDLSGRVDTLGQVDRWALVRLGVSHPRDAARVIRSSRATTRAARTLTDSVDRLLTALGA